MADKEKFRVKHFAFISYAENNDIDAVRQYLRKMAYNAAISPLHTPDDDELKPHYHILVTLPSVRDLGALNKEFHAVANITDCFRVGSLRGYARYLTHIDNPDKQQFNDRPEIFGSFPYDKCVFDKVEDYDVCNVFFVIDDILKSLQGTNRKVSYGQLLRILTYDDKHRDVLDYVVRHSYAINMYLRDVQTSHHGMYF